MVVVNSLFSPIPCPSREGTKRRKLGSLATEDGAVVAGSESRLVDDLRAVLAEEASSCSCRAGSSNKPEGAGH